MSQPEENHDTRIRNLYARLQARSQTRGTRRISLTQIGAAAAVLVLLFAALWFFPQRDKAENAPAAQTQMEPAGSGTPETQPSPWQSPENEQGRDIAVAEKSVPSTPAQPAPGNQATSAAGGASPPAGEIAAVEEISAQQDQMVAAPAAAPARTEEGEAPEKVMAKPAQDRATGEKDLMKVASNAKKAKESARVKDSAMQDSETKADMKAAGEKTRAENLPQNSEPAGGWNVFQEYLRQNARLTAEARNNNISGTVKIKFSVGANDEPQNFVNLQPLGYGCDEEAVRLIKSWNWVRGQNPEITVEIPFVR